MPGIDTHPTEDAIEAFALGKSDPAEGSRLEEHLAECERCQERAEAVAPDTVVQLLVAARTRADADRSAAATQSLAGSATPSLFAPTQAWCDPDPDPLGAAEPPAVLIGHPKYRVLGRPILKVAGWFKPVLAESYEMLYQSDSPYLFDSSKFARAFNFCGTPYADGIRATAASFNKTN